MGLVRNSGIAKGQDFLTSWYIGQAVKRNLSLFLTFVVILGSISYTSSQFPIFSISNAGLSGH